MADENQEIFPGKSQIANFLQNPKIFEIRVKSETGGKCIMVSGGMDAPGCSPQDRIVPHADNLKWKAFLTRMLYDV